VGDGAGGEVGTADDAGGVVEVATTVTATTVVAPGASGATTFGGGGGQVAVAGVGEDELGLALARMLSALSGASAT
jgi:hypothetical protein